jgi:hypothetical protein
MELEYSTFRNQTVFDSLRKRKGNMMLKLFIATLTTTLVIGIAGCKSTQKTDSANNTDNSRANESTLEHIGNDAKSVGTGAADAVGAGVKAVGEAGGAVIDSFKGKDKKSEHPKKKRSSDHPDHPGS